MNTAKMILVVDTETTGLPRRGAFPESIHLWPRLVSVAWQSPTKANSGSQLLVQPNGYKIPKPATDVHGISTEEAQKRGVPIQEALCKLVCRVKQAAFVACYNVEFDRGVLLSEAIRYGDAQIVDALKEAKWFCVMVKVQRNMGLTRPLRLEIAHKQLCSDRENYDDYHSALGDVKATCEVLLALFPEQKKLT